MSTKREFNTNKWSKQNSSMEKKHNSLERKFPMEKKFLEKTES